MTKNINKFQKDLKIKFKKKSLLIKALTHKSANQESNNEKLEFLGDRVIGLVLSKKLFDLYPKENEGVLDKRFASLVNRRMCCDIGWSIGIHNYIIIGNQKKRIDKKDEQSLVDKERASRLDKARLAIHEKILSDNKKVAKKQEEAAAKLKTAADKLEKETLQWSREMLQHSPLALRCLKSALNADCDGQAGLQELAGNATMMFYMSEEGQEGRNAYLERRKPDFTKFTRYP